MVPLLFSVVDLAHLRAIRPPFIRYTAKELEDVELASRIRALLPDAPSASPEGPAGHEQWSDTFELLSRLGHTGPFEGFTQEELAAFLDRSHVIECSGGQQIIAKGQATRAAFVLLEGAADAGRRQRHRAFREG